MAHDVPKYQVKTHETNNRFKQNKLKTSYLCKLLTHGFGSWTQWNFTTPWKHRTDPVTPVWWKIPIISHTKWHQMLTHTHKTYQIPRKQQPNQLPACLVVGIGGLGRWFAWTFDGAPGLPKICATLASLLPWSKGFGLWQGLGRRANTSLEALNKTTKMIHSLQNMFEVKLKFIMIEIRSHVWSQHCQNLVLWSRLRPLLLLNWLWKILSCLKNMDD